MYAAYFGLAQEPFSIAPDPRLLFMSDRHREALAHLLYGLGGGGGFVLLTGEIGTGKTTVCRCFLEQVPAHCNLAYIFNPKLTVAELLETACHEFGIAVPRREGMAPTVKDYLDPLNAFLLQSHAAGRNNVLVIDEAQNLSADVLEQLRLLTNLETAERKLLQIILVGQPELRTMLARPELEQLAQRVIARYHLQALAEPETAQYIRHRMEACGLQRPLPFDRRALARIHQRTGGVPRRINLLCDRALLGAYATGQASVTRAIVDKAALEVFDSGLVAPSPSLWRQPAFALGLGVAGAGVLLAAAAWTPWGPMANEGAAAAAARAPAPAASAPAAPAVAARAKADAAAPAMAAASATPAPAAGPASAAAQSVAAASAAAQPVGAASAAAPSVAAASAPAAAGAGTDLAAAPARAAASGPQPVAVLLRDADTAWRELATLWQLQPQGRDPCEALAPAGVQCVRRTLPLAAIRQLGRPGIITLDAGSGRPSYALLTGLSERTATLRAGGVEMAVPLMELGGRWQGEFATLWKLPPGYTTKIDNGAAGPLVDWVAQHLARARGEPPVRGTPRFDARLQAQLKAFQLAHSLPTDGRVGPLTLMQLERAAGGDQPRLRAQP